jgi:preprotein translocase subunit SecF
MSRFARFGNDLYTGKRSIDFVGRQRIWYAISGGIVVLALIGIFGRGLNFGLEFRGGSEFRVPGVTNTQNFEQTGRQALSAEAAGADVVVTKLGTNTIRVQTEKLTGAQTEAGKGKLAKAYGVPADSVTSSFVGASWGSTVSDKARNALIVFLVLVSLVLAAYFRTWKMSLAALVALVHDLVITVGIYALAGFEITPASVIGFLTILGYSLYDTVVVFDKVRENTSEAAATGRMSYSQAANLAVNQTLVRSINTSVVALLPVAAILVVGFTVLGPGTLLDLSLALFVGIAVGTYSSIFIATPILADLREREPAMQQLRERAKRYQAGRARAAQEAPVDAATAEATGVQDRPQSTVPAGRAVGATPLSRPLHPYAQTGPRNQPKRPPKSKR